MLILLQQVLWSLMLVRLFYGAGLLAYLWRYTIRWIDDPLINQLYFQIFFLRKKICFCWGLDIYCMQCISPIYVYPFEYIYNIPSVYFQILSGNSKSTWIEALMPLVNTQYFSKILAASAKTLIKSISSITCYNIIM